MISGNDLYTAFQGCAAQGHGDLLHDFRQSVQSNGINPDLICPERNDQGISEFQAAMAIVLNNQIGARLLNTVEHEQFYQLIQVACRNWNLIHHHSRLHRIITDNIINGNGYL